MSAEYPHSPTPEEIMEYVDGEAAPASRDAITAHLANCADCRAIAAEQRAISEHARAWIVDKAPVSLRPPRSQSHAWVPHLPAWRPSRSVMGVASVAAVVLLIVTVGSNQRISRSPAVGAAVDKLERSQMQIDLKGARGGVVGGVVGGLPAAAPAPPFMAELATIDASRRPAVIRTATIRVVAKDFSGVRSAVEALAAQAGGFIDHITVTGDTSTARMLRGTLRVPADRLGDTLARLRQIGQVVEDTQGSQDVTDQIVDLDARLASARATEKRLTELLQNRTGRLSDVLEVERELTRVRLDIERLDAEKTNVGRRVTYATIDVTVTEERKAGLDGPLSLATRIRVAALDGLQNAMESAASALLFLLRAGPTLALWTLGGLIAWSIARRIRRSPSA